MLRPAGPTLIFVHGSTESTEEEFSVLSALLVVEDDAASIPP
jgi:hypothetical protein